MTEGEIQYDNDDEASKRNLNDQQQQDRLDRENNPLPENISEYVQRARDELKQYEERKKFYEKRRKREIVLELVDLLEEHNYPKEWLRLIIAQELGDYISTSYIEKILAEKYPDEKKKVKEQSTRKTTEIPQNDDKIPIEVSTTGENILGVDDRDPGNITPCSHMTIDRSIKETAKELKTDLERQAEEGTREIVRVLQTQVRGLQAKCYQLDQFAKEGAMCKAKCTQLQQELDFYKDKIIKGTAQIEFGSEFFPIKIEYTPRTNQFSARIPEEVIAQILDVSRRQG